MRVAILGCGPAGLFAAEAARQQGASVHILTPRKTMSVISGAQYLHRPIPELSGKQEGVITYRKVGDRDMYAHKVYGNMAMDVSWDTFDEGEKPFWSLESAYVRAWMRHSQLIKEAEVRPGDIKALCGSYDLVVSTAPKNRLCLQPDRHQFNSQAVWVSLSDKSLGTQPNQIVYNGQRNVPWYRWSLISGFSSYEFPHKIEYKKKRVVEIHKPLLHFCDCHQRDNYLEVGRYGRWKKGALTHEAYDLTMEAIDAL